MKKHITGSLLAFLIVSAPYSEAKSFCYKHGMTSCSSSQVSTPVTPPVVPTKPVPDGTGVFDDNIARTSCKDFKTAYPSAKSGKYALTVNSEKYPVYCEMETDGGGWTQVYYQPSNFKFPTTEFTLRYRDVWIKNRTLKTLTADSVERPSYPDGFKNTFSRILFKGGNAQFRARHGSWFSFDMIENTNQLRVPAEYPNVRAESGMTRLFNDGLAFGLTTLPDANAIVIWGNYGGYDLCGGDGWPAPKNCPSFNSAQRDYTQHYDMYNAKSLYVK